MAEQNPPPFNHPEIPEVLATRKDALTGSGVRKRFRHFLQILYKQGWRLTLIEGMEQITRLTTGAPARRFSQITSHLHVGGQHNERGLSRLRQRGVTAVVSLRGELDDREWGIAPSRYLHLPTVDNHAPTLEHLRTGTAFIHEELKQGGMVYIHCWEGVGRAPTMAAAYLVSTGMTPDEAWKSIATIRPFIRPVASQLDQIERFAALHRE
jgi:predicted protein tyrosine phosphatase